MPPVVFREVSLNVKVVLQKGETLIARLIDRPIRPLFLGRFLERNSDYCDQCPLSNKLARI